MSRILSVFAHPDDEILACGGSMACLSQKGHILRTLILGKGRENTDTYKSIESANKVVGCYLTSVCDFPDNKFDSVPLMDIVQVIEKVKNDFHPDIIFTHYEKDLNIDHALTYRAVVTATRPMAGEKVKEIYSGFVASSTEWSYPLSFSPNVFFDISDTISLKLKALKEYESELRPYPHPRSLGGVDLLAKMVGMQVGLEYAEAFVLVRKINGL
jgi:LmbE family N-acetylglucosaminyl deacetylase